MIGGGTHETSVRSYQFYARDTISGGTAPDLTVNFSDCELNFVDQVDSTPFVSMGLIISNDEGASDEIEFSYDGVIIAGHLYGGESQNFFQIRRRKVYLRCPAGTVPPYRVWAW